MARPACTEPRRAEEDSLTRLRGLTAAAAADLAGGVADADLLHRVIAASSDCIVVMDLEANTLWVSPGGVAAMEIDDVASTLGRSWLGGWREEDRATAQAAVARARAGEVGRFQGFRPTETGAPRWWDLAVSALPGPDGSPERLVSIGRDITELKQAEARLGLTQEMAGLGAFETFLDTDEFVASDLFYRIFGLTPQARTPATAVTDLVVPQDRGRVTTSDDRRNGEALASTEYRIRRPDTGEVRWIERHADFLPAEGGRPARLVGAARDVTARKGAELRQAALVELGDRLRELRHSAEAASMAEAAAEILGRTLEVARAGYGRVDPLRACVSIERDWRLDAGVASIAGVHHFADYGAFFADLQAGRPVIVSNVDDDTRMAPAALRALQIEALLNFPLMERGTLVAVLFLHDTSRRQWTTDDLAFVGAVADRTWAAIEQAGAEAGLRRLNATLEARVAERAAALEAVQDQLRQSQKMEAVGQLTGGLAHDFNNLLTAISGSLELLQARVAQGRLDGIARYVGAAREASRRAAALTHRLLAFSRRQTLDPRPLDVDALVAGLEELVRRTAGPRVEVVVDAGAGDWSVLADASQLENAVLNLCINARDAMPDGGRLTVRTSQVRLAGAAARDLDLAPGLYVALSVGDTGTGMSPDVMARAFDPFFTTKPMGEGTGLGLSMVYGFVRQSGGQVRIASKPGAGATVRLYLRRHFEPAGVAVDTARTPDPVGAPLGRTVLVIEDEPAIRALVAEVLEDLGCTVLAAADGAAGLEWLGSERRIDLLLTDVGLPGGMNGRQVADAGRRLRPELPVMFVTGYAENAVVGTERLEPGMHVLTKPFELETLANKVRALVG